MFNKDLFNLIYSYTFDKKDYKFLSREDRIEFYNRIRRFSDFQQIIENKNLFINSAEVVLVYEILDRWHDKELKGEIFTVYMPNLKDAIVCKLMKMIYF